MSLATMQPKAPEPIDHELERQLTLHLDSVMANRGSLRLKLRLARLDHAESRQEILAILKSDLATVNPYKIEHTFDRLMKPNNFPELLTKWLQPGRPIR